RDRNVTGVQTCALPIFFFVNGILILFFLSVIFSFHQNPVIETVVSSQRTRINMIDIIQTVIRQRRKRNWITGIGTASHLHKVEEQLIFSQLLIGTALQFFQ